MDKDVKCIVRLRVIKEDGEIGTAFGKGTALLLKGVRELHSLNAAAKSIGMAYSKAWTSINETEAHLGFALIERNAQRGSELTEKGQKILQNYEAAEAAAQKAAQKVFDLEA